VPGERLGDQEIDAAHRVAQEFAFLARGARIAAVAMPVAVAGLAAAAPRRAIGQRMLARAAAFAG
jgi:hypothetical protein